MENVKKVYFGDKQIGIVYKIRNNARWLGESTEEWTEAGRSPIRTEASRESACIDELKKEYEKYISEKTN